MNFTLPNWMERLVGLEPVNPGQDRVYRLDTTWNWPPWVLLLFAIFSITFVAYFYAKEGSSIGRVSKSLMATIRLMLIFIVTLMLFGLFLSVSRTDLPYVVIIIDNSKSMDTADHYDKEQLAQFLQRIDTAELKQVTSTGSKKITRLDLAKILLLENNAKLLSNILETYKLKVYFLESSSEPSQKGNLDELHEKIKHLEASRESSPLGTRLRLVLNELRGIPTAAIIYLSDGINTEGPTLLEAAAQAQRRNIPLLAVGLGDEQLRRDLEIRDLVAEKVVFVNDDIAFDFKLHSRGFEKRSVRIKLLQEGHNEPVAEMDVKIAPDDPAGDTQKVRLLFQLKKKGSYTFTVKVEPLKEETDRNNNLSRQVQVEAREVKFKVLLVQAYPSFEFRFLKNMLQRDKKTIQLHTVLQHADLKYTETDELGNQVVWRIFPVDQDELKKYDVIIFGDVDPSLLDKTAMNNIVHFVDDLGKGIVFIAGPRYTPRAYRDTPLARLLPIQLNSTSVPLVEKIFSKGFRVEPTAFGRTTPQMQLGDTWEASQRIWRSQLPVLYWLLAAPELKDGAKTLADIPSADGSRLPVVCMQYFGAGKVILHLTDESWRWRYLYEDVLFRRYWFQTIRFLVRPKQVGSKIGAELSPIRQYFERGESVILRLRFLDETKAPIADNGVTVMLKREKDQWTQQKDSRRVGSNRGIFTVDFGKLPAGRYRAWVVKPTFQQEVNQQDVNKPLEENGKDQTDQSATPTASFEVKAPKGETQRLEMDKKSLQKAAELTPKGKFYTFQDAADHLWDDLPSGRRVKIGALPPILIWKRWELLLFFLVLLVLEWVLRKSKGMV